MALSKRGILTVLVMLILLSTYGCGGRGNPKSGEIVNNNYHTGSQGLVINFLPGSLPRSIYKGDPLEIVVEYSNKGAWDVTNAYLYISGYDKNYITFDRPYAMGIIANGKSEFNPIGEISKTETFFDNAVNMPPNVDVYNPRFLVTACYKYRTEAFQEACIDPDPYSINPQEKVCTVHDLGFGTQGAPVAVTSVEEVTSKNRVQFKVHVSNVGGGTVIDPRQSIADCHTRLKKSDVDKVSITAKFSNRFLKCEPDIVPLIGGSGVSVCVFDGDLGADAYLTILDIELDYGYRTSIMGSTNIYKIPGRD